MGTVNPAAQVQMPDAARVVQRITTDLAGGGICPHIRLVQYDTKLPIVAVHLQNGAASYALPDGAAANVRMTKTDGKGVYNPVWGISADRHTVYVEITRQMTACSGNQTATLEIIVGDMVKNTPPFILEVAPNPLADETYISTDEYTSIVQYVSQAEAAKNAAAQSASAAGESANQSAESAATAERNATQAATDAKKAKDAADKIDAEKIDDKLTQMGSIRTAVEKSATAAANSATAAANSATAAAKSAEDSQKAVEQATAQPLTELDIKEVLSLI